MADTMKTRAEQIRTETGEGKNTPERVGSLLVDICQSLADNATASTKAQSTADAASTAASEAKTAAESASEKAESASTAASEAKTAAESASEKAESASTAASEAKTAAESASTKAESASTAASAASTKAEAAQATADAHTAELAAHADTLKSHGTRITALEESGGGTAAVTHFMALAGEDCTITINGTAHTLTAHKPYETDLSLADDTLTSLVFDEAATRSLRTVRFTGKKVKWRAGDRFFCALPLLTSADITAIDTGGAAIMSFFVATPRVTRIDGLESLDTSSFPQIRGLHTCTALEKADPSLWDTSSATELNNFLYACGRLTGQIDLSQWDTSKVKSITGSVSGCGSLASIDLSGWDFSSLTTFRMGGDVASLTDVYAGEGWGKMPGDSPVLDLSGFTQWKKNNYGQNTAKTLLNLYDRAANGMGTMTLKLSSNTYAALTTAEIATLTAKGYTVTK